MPKVCAIEMASFIPSCAATKPKPLCASTCAAAGVICWIVGVAVGSRAFCRIRSM